MEFLELLVIHMYYDNPIWMWYLWVCGGRSKRSGWEFPGRGKGIGVLEEVVLLECGYDEW